jgi:hypothetical protein
MPNFVFVNPQPLTGTYPNPGSLTAYVTVTDDNGVTLSGVTVTVSTANTSIAQKGSGPFITDIDGLVAIPFSLLSLGSTTATFGSSGASSVTVPINVSASSLAPNWTIFLDLVDGSPPAPGVVSFSVGQTRTLQYRVYDVANNVDGPNHPVQLFDDGANALFTINAPVSGNTNASGRITFSVTANSAGSGEDLTARETVQNKTHVRPIVVNSVVGSIAVDVPNSSLKIYPEFSDNGSIRVIVYDTQGQIMSGVTVTVGVVQGAATVASLTAVTGGSPAGAVFTYGQSGAYVGFTVFRFTVGSITVDQQVKIANVVSITVNPTSLTSPYFGPVQNVSATVVDNFSEFVINRFNFLSSSNAVTISDVFSGFNTDGSGIAQIPVNFGVDGSATISLRTPTSAVLATIPVTVSAQVIPPQITSANSTTAAIGQAFTFSPTGTGSGPLVWTIVGPLPSWLDFNQAGAPILYSPTVTPNNVQPETVTFRLSNSAGFVDQVFTINKVLVGTPPVITSPLTLTGQVGQPFSVQLNATGTDPKVWSIVSATQGFTLSSTGLLQHPSLPAPAGNTTLQIVVANGISPDDNKLFTISKSAAPVPSEVTNNLIAVEAGIPFSQVLQISNNPTAVTVSPSWATVTSSVVGGQTVWTLSGTAPVSAIGTTNLTFSLTNNAGTNNQVKPLTVLVGYPINFVTAAAWTGAHGQNNFFLHQAVGGQGAITYSLANNDPAISINPTTGQVTVLPSLA